MSVFDIAKHPQDQTTTKQKRERIYRNLGREGVDTQLREALMRIISHQAKPDILFISCQEFIEKLAYV